MNCNYCKGICIKKGVYKNSQKYQCKSCSKYLRSKYLQNTYGESDEHTIRTLNNEGIGISSISRIMQIPKSSVLIVLERIARKIFKPVFKDRKEVYEVDELYTYIGKKEEPCFIIYAINRHTRQVIDFVVSARSKENIKKVIGSLLKLYPKKIYTDRLPAYRSLIPGKLHGLSRWTFRVIAQLTLPQKKSAKCGE